MRLIDADLLEDEVMHLFICITGNPKQHTVVNSCKESFRNMIEEQPTVEAVPAVRGEWIHVPSSDVVTGAAYKCSVCGKMRYGSFFPNFCQHCGADMRKRVQHV